MKTHVWRICMLASFVVASACSGKTEGEEAADSSSDAGQQPAELATSGEERSSTAAAADPWTKVPALPTACYTSQDNWSEQNDAAIGAVRADRERQSEINGAIERQAASALSENPMAIQQAIASDPQNAQKLIEQMMHMGQEAQTGIPAQVAKQQELEAESKTLMQRYEAALEKARTPATERLNALKKKLDMSLDTPIMMPDPAWPQWAWQEWPEILKLQDEGYAANCATWWAATGPIHGWMKRYQDYLVQERIPQEKQMIDGPKLGNLELMKLPTAGWRTTSDYEAAEDYMKMAATLFGQRQADPRCRAGNFCE